MSNPLPVSPDVLIGTVNQFRWVFEKWSDLMTAGIPGVTREGTREELEAFMSEFLGELQFTSLTAGNLYDVLAAGLQVGGL